MTPHIGIDFGTTKTLVSFINPHTDHPELIRLGRSSDILPTTVYFHADGHLDFGDDANDMIEDLDGSYIRGFKMELGSTTPLHMFISQGKIHNVCASDLVSKFLRYIRRRVQEEVFFGKPVTMATITRPVSFSPAQCEELRQAALAAGFTHVNFTSEPEAAALAFCRLDAAQAFKKSALIVDWGGGTLDLALVTRSGNGIKIHRNLVAGDMEIGGEKFDEALWNHTSSQLHHQGVTSVNEVSQLPKVRRAKEQLSGRDNVTLRLSHGGGISPVSLSRTDFNRLIHAHVEKACGIVQSLLARIPTEDKPEMLILVGGSSSIPLIKEKLEAACGLSAHKWHYSREAVAFGAAMWSDHIGESKVSPYDQAKAFYDAEEYEKAIPLLRQAAEQGQADNQCLLGDCYLNGWGVTENPAEAIKWFRKAADQGHADAQNMLGMCYLNGWGVAKNLTEAIKWFRKAAGQDDATAQYNLGQCYRKGWGITENPTEAVKWFHKAANQGHADAQNWLGQCFFKGWGVAENPAEAVKWFRKAAAQGRADAQNRLGNCYLEGWGVTKDPSMAVKWFRKAAGQGRAGAQCNLGNCYLEGWGVAENPVEAVKWYRKAAEQGRADAQNMLGLCFFKSWGVAENPAEAVKWFRKAAVQGDAMAQFNLGQCYLNGWGVAENPAEAVKWFRKVAEQGHVTAQYNLGQCYLNGWGVTANPAEAVKWFRKAAEQGMPQNNLEQSYLNGWGTMANPEEAVKWYHKAAVQGQADAQCNLGDCYLNGWGATANPEEAVKWYSKAAEQGDATAQYNLGQCYLNGWGVTANPEEAAKWFSKVAKQSDAEAEDMLGCATPQRSLNDVFDIFKKYFKMINRYL